MTLTREISVAIVQGDASLGIGLQAVVESSDNLQCAGLWTTGREALKKIEAFRPQVVLMAVNLPDISGIEITSRIKARFPEIQIVMFTGHRAPHQIFAALKAGASGYILHSSGPAEIRTAIKEVHAGGAPMSGEIARSIVESFHRSDRPGPADLNLSVRETEVMENLSKGLTNKEIAGRLCISVEAVRMRLKKLYEKLEVHSRTEAAIKYQNSREPHPWADQLD